MWMCVPSCMTALYLFLFFAITALEKCVCNGPLIVLSISYNHAHGEQLQWLFKVLRLLKCNPVISLTWGQWVSANTFKRAAQWDSHFRVFCTDGLLGSTRDMMSWDSDTIQRQIFYVNEMWSAETLYNQLQPHLSPSTPTSSLVVYLFMCP